MENTIIFYYGDHGGVLPRSKGYIYESGLHVPLVVYVPPKWSKTRDTAYPLLILLHGQGETETTFPDAIKATNLNNWINQGQLPEMIVIALRGGKNTKDMQWYDQDNVAMITNEGKGELRMYSHEMFNTSLDASQIALIGHSRGASGALYFAFNFPDRFQTIVSSAYVSDYNLDMLKKAATANVAKIKRNAPRLKLLIGTKDQFALQYDRKGSYIMSEHLKGLEIPHSLDELEGVNHYCDIIWSPVRSLEYLKYCSQDWR